MENPENPKFPNYEKAAEKSRRLGFFSLTMQDHKNMGSSPPKELLENPDKAQYEVMTEEEIVKLLDNALVCMYDPIFIKNRYAKAQKDFFVASLSFLKSVDRLPKKFEDFDLESLPEL